jgi:hypothetical protein
MFIHNKNYKIKSQSIKKKLKNIFIFVGIKNTIS